MKFLLFSKIEFEVFDPVALIECYCFQSDFYKNYDLLLPDRKLEAVSKIGARIPNELLQKCKELIERKESLPIFGYDDNLEEFLDLCDEVIENHVRDLSNLVKELTDISGIGLSKATKILHTRYPGIIPMIDNQLRGEYERINQEWRGEADTMLLDYYHNLKRDPNRQNLSQVHEAVSKTVPKLTKVRVFDILWWSFLKAKTLKENEGINWSTMKW